MMVGRVAAFLMVMTLSAAPAAAQSPRALRKAQKLLERLELVDGAGSGLDADLLQGQTLAAVIAAALAQARQCAPDAVRVGTVCIDKYEASVWDSLTGGNQLTTEAQIDAACPKNGQPAGTADCVNFYARSVSGVEPARNISWFQAQQALANSGKRLPTNAEWQAAVSGTPDSNACNIDTGSLVNTGAKAGCVSRFGAFDMVGNVWEWVADWDEQADDCGNWPAELGTDITCFGAGIPSRRPGALNRGGSLDIGPDTTPGPFAADASFEPWDWSSDIGVRGAR
jgi:hypothetical protein